MKTPLETIRLQPDKKISGPKSTGIILQRGDEDEALSVYFHNSYANDDTIAVGLPWSEFVQRPDATSRLDTMAVMVEQRVVACDNPGVSPGFSTLPEFDSDQEDVFDVAARLQFDRAGYLLTGELSLIGYSMGAIGVSKLIEPLKGEKPIRRLVLLEPVGVKKMSVPRLAARFAREAHDWAGYKAENPVWQRERMSESSVSQVPFILPNFAYARGIAKAPLLETLTRARQSGVLAEDTEVVLARGSKSTVSNRSEMEQLTRHLEVLGLTALRAIEFEGESHGMIDSLPRYIAAIKEITK